MLHLEEGDKYKSSANIVEHNKQQSLDDETPSSSGVKSNNTTLVNLTTSNDNSTKKVKSNLTQNYKAPTILPTALVYIEKGGELFTVMALLDTCSEKFIVSNKFSNNFHYR